MTWLGPLRVITWHIRQARPQSAHLTQRSHLTPMRSTDATSIVHSRQVSISGIPNMHGSLATMSLPMLVSVPRVGVINPMTQACQRPAYGTSLWNPLATEAPQISEVCSAWNKQKWCAFVVALTLCHRLIAAMASPVRPACRPRGTCKHSRRDLQVSFSTWQTCMPSTGRFLESAPAVGVHLEQSRQALSKAQGLQIWQTPSNSPSRGFMPILKCSQPKSEHDDLGDLNGPRY